jgi:hypothetical protein
MDRCALFVDAGYVLADGAMAVHGTRRRDSVSWDYSGLLKLLAGISRDQTGLPLMRCYWYEATVEGRRSREHDLLADLPGLKLRLGRMRPGRREGVETEIHRDLITLARNGAICDAVIISAEEDLAEVVAEVQDLGVRVILLHVAVDGVWTVARPLRRECDDIVEISGAHLRPFVDLIAGAEPAGPDEQYRNGGQHARALGNGHSSNLGALSPDLPGGALPPGSAIYTAPVITDYQRAAPTGAPAQPSAGQQFSLPARSDHLSRPGYGLAETQGADQGGGGGAHAQRPASGGMHEQADSGHGRPGFPAERAGLDPGEYHGRSRSGQHEQRQPGSRSQPGSRGQPAMPGPDDRQAQLPGRSDVPARSDLRNPPASHARRIEEDSTVDGYRDYQPDPLTGPPAQLPPPQLPPPQRPSAQLAAAQRPSAQLPSAQYPGPPGQPGAPGLMLPPAGRPPQGPYSGPQPATGPPSGPQPVTVSLADAVQAAHAEGFGFGDAVARDAPALWLEAVLARKPRMPSDLEARLLQGSALPIDSLLHDEVRHALRRGFWDALERSRR